MTFVVWWISCPALRVMAVDRPALEAIHTRLLSAYGPQGWWPGESRFEIIAGALLVQRTTWLNAARALDRLRGAGVLSSAALAVSTEAAVAELVRPAGFYRQKAARLVTLSRWLEAEGGCDALATHGTDRLRAIWLAQPGVGPETADAILLYAYGHPVFVVDAYTRRLFARLGLIRGDEAYERLRGAVEGTLAADAACYNEYHALIVAHAKAHCGVRPRCVGCTLAAHCAEARRAR